MPRPVQSKEHVYGRDPDSWTARGIKDLREQLAAVSGDIDGHVAVLATIRPT
jgi:hypothetical protein